MGSALAFARPGYATPSTTATTSQPPQDDYTILRLLVTDDLGRLLLEHKRHGWEAAELIGTEALRMETLPAYAAMAFWISASGALVRSLAISPSRRAWVSL